MREALSSTNGFTLLETLVSVTLVSLAISMVITMASGFVKRADVASASLQLIEVFRFAQSEGATSSKAGTVWLDPYDNRYQVTHGTDTVIRDAYPEGIGYVDGYLQLSTRRISYDDLGDAQVAGSVRLTDGLSEQDIRLYMGTGLQIAGWVSA